MKVVTVFTNVPILGFTGFTTDDGLLEDSNRMCSELVSCDSIYELAAGGYRIFTLDDNIPLRIYAESVAAIRYVDEEEKASTPSDGSERVYLKALELAVPKEERREYFIGWAKEEIEMINDGD